MLTGLHHITLIGSDIARTAGFSTTALGLRLVEWPPTSPARN